MLEDALEEVGLEALDGRGPVALAARVGEVLRRAGGVVEEVDVLAVSDEEGIEGGQAAAVSEQVERVLPRGGLAVGDRVRLLPSDRVEAHVLDDAALDPGARLDLEGVEDHEAPRRTVASREAWVKGVAPSARLGGRRGAAGLKR
ncbi:MAG: hypothetical protein HY721_33940 [Planctomycetes bacterium]|nr:hypothetical protein [Planctomycetota bacterium]